MLITFLLGICRDVTSGGALRLLLFVGTWERNSARRGSEEKQVGHVRSCCLVVCDASGRAFTVNSHQEVFFFFFFCKYPFIQTSAEPQVAAEQVYVGASFSELKAAFVLLHGARLCGREPYVLLVFVCNG